MTMFNRTSSRTKMMYSVLCCAFLLSVTAVPILKDTQPEEMSQKQKDRMDAFVKILAQVDRPFAEKAVAIESLISEVPEPMKEIFYGMAQRYFALHEFLKQRWQQSSPMVAAASRALIHLMYSTEFMNMEPAQAEAKTQAIISVLTPREMDELNQLSEEIKEKKIALHFPQ